MHIRKIGQFDFKDERIQTTKQNKWHSICSNNIDRMPA